MHSGASDRNSAASAGVTNTLASAVRAMARSNASSRSPSRLKTFDSGQGRDCAYCRHLAESTSTKSTTTRRSRLPDTYCAIADENTTAFRICCSRTVVCTHCASSRIVIVAQRQRLAAPERGKAAYARHRRPQFHHFRRSAVLGQSRDVLEVRRVVDEGSEVNAIARRQVLEQVERTHLVALVRRKGDAMREKEQRFHVVRDQPRLRTMCGPSALAAGRGKRRHSAMNARYFGLSGLFCGTSARVSSWYS